MGPLILLAFTAWCGFALRLTPLALNLLMLFFPLEQVIQSAAGFFRNSATGLRAANYIVGLITALSVGLALAREPDRIAGTLTAGQTMVWSLYVWTIASCAWSPGAELAIESLSGTWPYLVLFLIFAPMMIRDLTELGTAFRWALVACVAMSLVMLVSPEFTQRGGRLGLVIDSSAQGARSSPLAIGELGGMCIILAALAGGGGRNPALTILRLTAVSMGTTLAVLSGSRGQLIFAIIAVAIGIPISRPLKNTRNYLLVIGGIAVVIPLILYVASIVAESGSADMAKRWGADSSESGTAIRAANVTFLLDSFMRSPLNWIQGLGYYAFGATNPYGEPYTHVLFVDMLCEEGLVGAALMLGILVNCARSIISLYQRTADRPEDRRTLGVLATIIIYQILLANKQGNIGGTFALFMLLILPGRLNSRAELGLDSSLPPTADGYQ
jgi:O-antigen ligase